ncbi:MAG: 50S ribosomal protein L21 [Lentisphaerota bacterium]
MEAYAVIETGGKQYLVQKGSVLQVELLDAEPGKTVEISKVLASSDGKEITVGTPTLSQSVKAEVVRELRGKKVVAFKKKRRKGYHKKIGHRQNLMEIKVLEISA